MTLLSISAPRSGELAAATSPVITRPGAIALLVMPKAPSSRAAAWQRPITAALLAA
jgi:hypothetical protein